MKKINAVVVGSGNIGRHLIEAVQSAEDFNLLGVVRRKAAPLKEYPDLKVVDNIEAFENVDVALLGIPSREISVHAKTLLAKGINTVDSFDIHSDILSLRNELMPIAKAHSSVAVIASGWDPGSDSVIRALFLAMAPKGLTYTNFGPGMSMGHTVAVKAIDGVTDALSMTIPVGTGIHRRMVYVVLNDGYTKEQVEKAIRTDEYFIHDEVHISFVPDIDVLKDVGHGVSLTRKGVSGSIHNQNLSFTMSINNPALTAQIMVASARAGMRQKEGVYTLIELPMIDLLEGTRDHWIQQLV